MQETTGARLRALREGRGLSLSELARRSGVGKGTVSELEHDLRAPRLDTLFALTTALDAPLGALLPGPDAPLAQRIEGAAVSAVLIDRWTVHQGLVEVFRASVGPNRQHSAAHAAGVEETVVVVSGRVRVGPDGDDRELGPGESLRYPGDVSHGFASTGGPAEVVLLMHYPTAAEEETPAMADEPQLPERSRIVQQHLRDSGLEIRVRELPDSTRTAPDAAAALQCDVGAIASSLLLVADDEPLLVMTSGAHRVDLDVVADEVGATAASMATAKQVRAVTGQAIGGVAPVGHPAPIRTVVDAALAGHTVLWAAAGTPHTVMPLTFDQLVALTNGRVVRVAAD